MTTYETIVKILRHTYFLENDTECFVEDKELGVWLIEKGKNIILRSNEE